jgi:hypothetical protein
MGTFPTISQRGGSRTYTLGGQNITTHEVWAFTLTDWEQNVGALISNVTVFGSQDVYIPSPSYNITLSVVDPTGNLSNGVVMGNFESTGI